MAGDVNAAVRRAAAALAADDVVAAMAEDVSGADLTSLLLEVMRRRAGARSPADLLHQVTNDRLVEPGWVDARALHRTIATVLDALPATFDVLELSPVAPLGTHSTVATVHQHKVVTTVRGSEVAADPTNTLAIIAAIRRRSRDGGHRPTRLAAVQRVLRAQPFGAVGQQHFTVLGLLTAGSDEGNLTFEREALGEHLQALVDATRAVTAAPVRIAITNLHDSYTGALVDAMREVVIGAEVVADPDRTAGRGYYEHLCFKVFVDGPAREIEIGDGGFTDWTRQLVGSRKERLLTSGLGIDRLASLVGD